MNVGTRKKRPALTYIFIPGYMSQTKIKFLAVVEDDAIPGTTAVSNPLRDSEIKRLLVRLGHYIPYHTFKTMSSEK
jgi:hypothetical protein